MEDLNPYLNDSQELLPGAYKGFRNMVNSISKTAYYDGTLMGMIKEEAQKFLMGIAPRKMRQKPFKAVLEFIYPKVVEKSSRGFTSAAFYFRTGIVQVTTARCSAIDTLLPPLERSVQYGSHRLQRGEFASLRKGNSYRPLLNIVPK